MAERRTLVEGLAEIETEHAEAAQQFLGSAKARRTAKPEPPAETVPTAATPTAAVPELPAVAVATPIPAPAEKPRLAPLLGLGRVPVGARIRTELASALKRASLERQLQGLEPNSVQDILEDALEPWLRTHGYLK
jgi:hypothetical protein